MTRTIKNDDHLNKNRSLSSRTTAKSKADPTKIFFLHCSINSSRQTAEVISVDTYKQ